MRRAILSLPLLALACTASNQERAPGRHAERIAAAQPVGPPIDCVDLVRIRSTHVLDDRTIDFEMTDGDTYRNVLPHSCPSLGFEEAFSYKTSLSRLCAVDFITVLDQAGGLHRGASCGLGKFQPVTFPDR
jgi:hypothetical protein